MALSVKSGTTEYVQVLEHSQLYTPGDHEKALKQHKEKWAEGGEADLRRKADILRIIGSYKPGTLSEVDASVLSDFYAGVWLSNALAKVSRHEPLTNNERRAVHAEMERCGSTGEEKPFSTEELVAKVAAAIGVQTVGDPIQE